LDWIDRIVVGWTGFLALFFGSEMRGADGIWSLGGTFWGEAGRGKNAAGARAQVCFFFFEKILFFSPRDSPVGDHCSTAAWR